jgi:predicted ATPase
MAEVKFNSSFTFDFREARFGVESKYVVATGAPISGKTSVLKALGVPFEPEVARVYIEREIAKGRTKTDIRADEGAFQRGLVDTKLAIEASRPKDQPWFFDRAMPDSITYYRAAGLDPSSLLPDCKHVRYALVLQFDPLPDSVVERILADDPVRTEDPETRRLLDRFLERDYSALGYDVLRVPVMDLNERLAFVKENLRKRGIRSF